MSLELDVGQSALLTDLATCINYYRLFSPGLYCCVHATVQLEDGTRFCPGIVVQVNHGPLKLCDPDPSYNVFAGPPNFILDFEDVFHHEVMLLCKRNLLRNAVEELQGDAPVRPQFLDIPLQHVASPQIAARARRVGPGWVVKDRRCRKNSNIFQTPKHGNQSVGETQ